MNDGDFYTLRGYDRRDNAEITYTMEDYLEMIYRCLCENEFVRVNQLAALLNVTPPSSSKMVIKLKESGMVEYEPYGTIRLTEQGACMGKYLLHRHEILHTFFCWINNSANELELVEKIEHFIDQDTVKNIEKWLSEKPPRQG